MWKSFFNTRIEDPVRLQHFLSHLEGIDWHGDKEVALDKLFVGLNDLVHHEITYYYSARKRHKLISDITRGLGLILVTAGSMAPLVANVNPEEFKDLAFYGYPLLAAAAGVLAFNRLFGATGGHVRYVTAQIELERLTTRFRLAWCQLKLATQEENSGDVRLSESFLLFQSYMKDVYKVLQAETSEWGLAISNALRELEIQSTGKRD